MTAYSCCILARFGIAICYVLLVDCHNCSEVICPSNQPYCTPLGCLFECPKDSFIDGQSCRTDCGENYIHRNKCVKMCPHTSPFVQIKISVVSHGFLKLQYCREYCPGDMFIMNKTCVNSCPDYRRYIENNTCIPKCQNDKLRLNVTLDGRLTAIRCIASCNFGQFIQDGFCVDSCLINQVIYKNVCQKDCPQNAQIKDTDYKGNTFCKTNCGDSLYRYIENGYCVNSCSNGQVVSNQTCTKACPKEEPLKHIDIYGTTSCHSSCNISYKTLFEENGYCVTKCNEGANVYQNKCVTECPKDAPIVIGDYTRYCKPTTFCANHYNHFAYNTSCVRHCPSNASFVYEMECMDMCPPEAPLYCQEDYNECKLSVYYSYIGQRKLKCLVQCPTSWKLYNSTCLRECPYHTYISNDTCVDSCSNLTPYIHVRSCVSECPSEGTWKLYNRRCVQTCPEKTFIQSENCVENCSGLTPYVHGNSCVSACPTSGIWKLYNNKCFLECPAETYVFEKVCVDNCTGNVPYMYERTCVSECPLGSQREGQKCLKIVETTTLPPNGLKVCKEDELLDNETCIKKTSCEKVIVFNGTCSNSCPVGFIYTRVKKDPCLSRKDLIGSILFYLGIGIVFIIFTVAFCSMKRFNVCKVRCSKRERQMSTTSENTEDFEPLLENETVDENSVV